LDVPVLSILDPPDLHDPHDPLDMIESEFLTRGSHCTVIPLWEFQSHVRRVAGLQNQPQRSSKASVGNSSIQDSPDDITECPHCQQFLKRKHQAKYRKCIFPYPRCNAGIKLDSHRLRFRISRKYFDKLTTSRKKTFRAIMSCSIFVIGLVKCEEDREGGCGRGRRENHVGWGKYIYIGSRSCVF